MEDVAGQALGVNADEHVLLAVDVALDERDVVLAGEGLAEGDGGEVPYAVGSRTEVIRSTSFSVWRRYSIRSSTVIILIPCCSQ